MDIKFNTPTSLSERYNYPCYRSGCLRAPRQSVAGWCLGLQAVAETVPLSHQILSSSFATLHCVQSKLTHVTDPALTGAPDLRLPFGVGQWGAHETLKEGKRWKSGRPSL